MERILTNLQVEWLTNIKLLTEYEDSCFSKEEMSEKFASFVESEHPGEELEIVWELRVLEEKGLIKLDAEISGLDVAVVYVCITKKGRDYLTMLEEDFAEKIALNQGLVDMIKEKELTKKDTLDYIEQISTIMSNISGLVPSIGNFCQGAIPVAKKLANFCLPKTI